jgi:UDP-glucuronate decarboxylase
MQAYPERKAVLVTGGAGFLGSYVCERLVSEGLHVTCVDNFLTGRESNIRNLLGKDNFTLIRSDISDYLPDEKYAEIWNLACPASPPTYQVDPVHTMMTSVLGTKRCLDLARKHGSRLFQASTSEVYGDPEVHPQSETYRGHVNTTGPRACYDEGKRAAEALCFDYHRTYGVEVKVVRIFNTYGPRMDPSDGRVVSNFIVAALQGRPLELYGEGHQTRSFCYVEDLIEGFFLLMRSPPEVTGPINIGNPGEFRVRELADIVLELTASSSALVSRPMPQDDPRQRQPVIDVARRLLGWEPRVDLLAGLRATIAYFERELSFPTAVAAE